MNRSWRIAVLLVLCVLTLLAVRRPLDPLHGLASPVQQTGKSANFDHLIKMIEDTMHEETARVEARTPFGVPLSADEIRNAVQFCLHHVLTDPDHAHSREFYGTPGTADVVLVNDGDIPWPDGLNLNIEGFRLRFGAQSNSDPNQESDRLLGIHLSALDVQGPATGLLDGNIRMVLSNVGGTRNGMVIGGCSIYFAVDKVDGVVQVRHAESLDP